MRTRAKAHGVKRKNAQSAPNSAVKRRSIKQKTIQTRSPATNLDMLPAEIILSIMKDNAEDNFEDLDPYTQKLERFPFALALVSSRFWQIYKAEKPYLFREVYESKTEGFGGLALRSVYHPDVEGEAEVPFDKRSYAADYFYSAMLMHGLMKRVANDLRGHLRRPGAWFMDPYAGEYTVDRIPVNMKDLVLGAYFFAYAESQLKIDLVELRIIGGWNDERILDALDDWLSDCLFDHKLAGTNTSDELKVRQYWKIALEIGAYLETNFISITRNFLRSSHFRFCGGCSDWMRSTNAGAKLSQQNFGMLANRMVEKWEAELGVNIFDYPRVGANVVEQVYRYLGWEKAYWYCHGDQCDRRKVLHEYVVPGPAPEDEWLDDDEEVYRPDIFESFALEFENDITLPHSVPPGSATAHDISNPPVAPQHQATPLTPPPSSQIRSRRSAEPLPYYRGVNTLPELRSEIQRWLKTPPLLPPTGEELEDFKNYARKLAAEVAFPTAVNGIMSLEAISEHVAEKEVVNTVVDIFLETSKEIEEELGTDGGAWRDAWKDMEAFQRDDLWSR